MLENGNIYVGERYLPIGAGAWDITKQYEQLVMVTHEGATYISTKPVPSNTDITNTEYWLPMYQPSETITELQDDVAQNMADIADIYQKLANGGGGSPIFVDMRDVDGVVDGTVIDIGKLPDDLSKVYVVPNDKDYSMTSSNECVRAVIAFPPSFNYNLSLIQNINLICQPLFFPNSMLIEPNNFYLRAPLPVVKQEWSANDMNIYSTIPHTIIPHNFANDTTLYEIATPATVGTAEIIHVLYGFAVTADTTFKNIAFDTRRDAVNVPAGARANINITFENCIFNLANGNYRIVDCSNHAVNITFKNCKFTKPCAALGGTNIELQSLVFEGCKFNEQVMLLDQAETLHHVEFHNCVCYEEHGIALRSTKWSVYAVDSLMQFIHSASQPNVTYATITSSQVNITGTGTVTFQSIHNSQINMNVSRYNLPPDITKSEIYNNGDSNTVGTIAEGVFENVKFTDVNIGLGEIEPARTFNVCTFVRSNIENLTNAVYLNGDDSKLPGGGGGSSESNSLYDCYFYPGTSSGGYSKNLQDWQPCTLQNLILCRQYKPVGPDNPLGWIVFNDAEITFRPHNIKYGSTLSSTKNLVTAQDGTLDDGRKVYKIYDLTATQDIPNGISVITYRLAQSNASTAIHAGLIIVLA